MTIAILFIGIFLIFVICLLFIRILRYIFRNL